MEPVEDIRQPIPSMEDHGDVDLRTSAVIPPVISLPKPISPVPEESEMTLFGTQDTDLRVLPSLVQKLAAAIRQKKENNVKEPVEPVIEEAEVPPPAPHITPIDRLAAALKRTKDIVPEEPEIPVPPPPTLPKKVEEKVEAPPPPKLPKIPKKVKPEPDDKEVKIIEEKVKPKVEEEKKKRKEEKGRRSPKRKRARSPALTRSPPRKRERERSPAPLQAGRSPLLEWDNRSRSPISRPHAVESPTRRRGWKDIKEKQEEKRVHEPDRRRERDRDHGFERGLIREREAERGIGREREPATERERRERELFGERVLGREPVSDRSLRDVVGDRGLRIERGPGPRPAAFRGLERQRGRRGMERGGRRFREDDDSADYILEEAEQQFKNGIITKRQFTDIVNDVMQRRESRLLREAQRRDGFLLPMHPEGPRGPHPRGPRPLPPRPLLEPHMGPRPLLDMRPQVPHGFGPRPLLETPKRLETTLELNVINIDDIPREVRFYGETAVALMAANEPRELSFCKEEVPRAVRVDGQIVGEIVVGDEYRELFFGNRPHMVKTGAPTRELFIDGNGFEYMFEAPDSPFTIDGRVHHIGISGPRPQVSFGKDLRTDLIAGRTEMILNGDKIIPIYLDALEQKFEVKGVIHTLRFENALQTVLFDGVPYRPNFGGLPVRIELAGEAHYARFLSLPEGVVPGQISIVGMKSEPIMPVPAIRERIPERPLPPPSPGIRKLDRIASSMATVMANNRPAIGYSADSLVPPPAEPPGLNVHALFSRLLATGLLDQTEKVEPKLDEVKTAEEIVAKAETDAIDSVSLQIDSLRLRRLPIIDMLYKGVQCNSCGLRFPAEKTCQYSQHLDWHFRQNRREKAYGRKPQSRSWHYTIGDWSKFEEFGEERGWFEGGEASDTESISSSPEPELPTVPADSENPELNQCAVCREEIPQFFDEELEEWRLRDAVREDAKTFHSACYEDFKSHGEPGLFPGLDLPVEEEEEVPKEKPEAKTEEPTAVKEEAPEEPAIKEEPTAEPTEVKSEEVKIEAKTPPPEELAEVETNPPTPVVDEVSVKEEERDIGTPVEDEKTIEVAPVIDIVETSERIVSSLDGNLELSEGAAAPVQVSKIRFNITAPSLKQKEPEKVEVESHTTWKHKEIEVSEPQTELDEMPPGEEPIVTLKPRMMGRKFKQMPVVAKGRDESGLCTIM